jgi:hypothetical protein
MIDAKYKRAEVVYDIHVVRFGHLHQPLSDEKQNLWWAIEAALRSLIFFLQDPSDTNKDKLKEDREQIFTARQKVIAAYKRSP